MNTTNAHNGLSQAELSDLEIGRRVSAYFYNHGTRPTPELLAKLLSDASTGARLTADAEDLTTLRVTISGKQFLRRSTLLNMSGDKAIDFICANQ